jgi:DNA-binding transcriptional MerR regulator
MGNGTYTIQVLLQDLGITARTWRHWTRQKVVPRPIGKGRGARYDSRHLMRGRAVKALLSRGTSLRRIRGRIETLSEQELAALAPPPPRPTTPQGVPLPPPPPTYPSVTWEVVQLMDGLALMVNPNRGELLRRIADDIFRHYGSVRAST